MHPKLITIGPFTIYTYGFFIAAAFLLGMTWTMREARTRGLDPKLVSDLGFYLILGGILGARLLYVLICPGYFLKHPLEIFMFWKGGLVFLGGAIVGAICGFVFLRKKKQPIWPWLDAIAPGLALGQAVGRLGCFSAGCCYGKKCSLPWAVTFTNPDSLAPLYVPLHPTQIYHSLAGLLTFILLLSFKKRLKGPGQLMGMFLILYSVLRFSIEFFRGDYRGTIGFLSVTQVLALGLFALGFLILLKRRT
jgi:phosphatidylglycerol:prolipoprotein diacylglycerol transferase